MIKDKPKKYLFYFSKDNQSHITSLIPSEYRHKFLFGMFVPKRNQKYKLSNLQKHDVKSLKNKEKYLVLDSKYEGFSTIYKSPKLDKIYSLLDYWDISPSQTIYVTMNMNEQKNIEEYASENNRKPIDVYSKPFSILEIVDKKLEKANSAKRLKKIKQKVVSKSNNQHIFLNLNNRQRTYRSNFAFYLASGNVKDYMIQTHREKYVPDQEFIDRTNRTLQQAEDWSKKETPLEYDYNITTNPELYYTTFFEVVGETLQEDWKGTSRELSEKTFRPISLMQPFLIYGQKGCNHYLKELGFKTYDEWFNLSFDLINDPVERMISLNEEIEKTVRLLNHMTLKEKIEWRFKNQELLIHNYECLIKLAQDIGYDTYMYFCT